MSTILERRLMARRGDLEPTDSLIDYAVQEIEKPSRSSKQKIEYLFGVIATGTVLTHAAPPQRKNLKKFTPK